MGNGLIYKALSGFYYVYDEGQKIQCRAKGRFRNNGMSPLVGDRVVYELTGKGTGIISDIEKRKNSFIRPAVANIDEFVFFASGAKPVTDPFLIDRVSVIAESSNCGLTVCINKKDLEEADELFSTYSSAGFPTVRTSAETGEGVNELLKMISGKVCVFTGNSGVGKSSILNRVIPEINQKTAQISDKIGRGKHTTRHIEMFSAGNSTFIADTPGFASFDIGMVGKIKNSYLDKLFIEFEPFLGKCRFDDCRHFNEPGCALKEAVVNGFVNKSRYDSYIKLYDIVSNNKPWD